MRISTKGRYSLEALLYMALLPEGTYASTRSIAENTGMSDGYLEQLFIPLRKAGIVCGVRGSQGGYFPGKAADEIMVGEVLRTVEGSMEPVDCVHSKICPRQNACLSRHTWSELYTEINKCIDTISLQDLVDAYKTMDKDEYCI
ncbi:MAG: Rrf2 family transcriptional regulator [Treponema sp.]|jgi:Rrf2 family protein|nr:Rrf2 family transcriptional regulator [Treponema sp.]MDR1220773.1 Rrf2 family transcriptional regulator [Treponema sp.]